MTPQQRSRLARDILHHARRFNFHCYWMCRSPSGSPGERRHARLMAQAWAHVNRRLARLGLPPFPADQHKRLTTRYYFDPQRGSIGSFI